jgi:hypothetical protein
MTTKYSRPLPERVEVNAHALTMIINALNGHGHEIRELQVTRGFGLNLGLGANPIDVLERELMAAQNPPKGQAYLDAVAEAEDYANCELRNHKRQGGLSVDQVMVALKSHFPDANGEEGFKAALEQLANGK